MPFAGYDTVMHPSQPLVSWLVWQRQNFAWTATLLLSSDWGVTQCCQNGLGHHPKADGGERLLTCKLRPLFKYSECLPQLVASTVNWHTMARKENRTTVYATSAITTGAS